MKLDGQIMEITLGHICRRKENGRWITNTRPAYEEMSSGILSAIDFLWLSLNGLIYPLLLYMHQHKAQRKKFITFVHTGQRQGSRQFPRNSHHHGRF